ncbi:MAG: DUF4446 family protein [Firmicutes bacterium]|jgi:hypothetical protein|nr:DUF4446 family protein [Bacillota bacterium]
MERYFYLFAGAIIILFIICLFVYFRLLFLQKKYRQFMADSTGSSLEEKLGTLQREMQALLKEVSANRKEMHNIQQMLAKTIRGYGVVRFNAFQYTGGELSFAVALLDGRRNGVVLSSIYGRDESRMYAKPIIAASSTYALSKEELEAIEKAVKMLEQE